MKLKKLSSLLLTCTLLMLPTSSFDAKQVTPQDNPYVTVTEGNKVTRSFDLRKSNTNMNLLIAQDGYETDNASINVESAESILKELGYTDVELNAIGDEEISKIFEDAQSVSVTEEYIKIDENGNKTSLSKEECLDKVANVDNSFDKMANSVVALSNSSSNEQTDGYMKMLTTSSYTYSGYYQLSATFTWLNMPDYRMTDAFSIAAPACAWSQKSGDIYSKFTYNTFSSGGGYGTQTMTNAVHVEQTGIYSKYNLPNDAPLDTYSGTFYNVIGMVGYIRGKARVSNWSLPTSFNVYSRYEHIYSAISIQPSFDWISLGISASTSIVNNTRTYTSYNLTNYKP